MQHAEQLYNEHSRAMVLFARQITGNMADAEDAVQEGFLRAFNKGASLPEHIVPWIYAAIRWSALDIVRRRQRRERHIHQFKAEHEEPSYFEAQTGEDGEFSHAVGAMLSTLPDPQREVVVLKLWGRLSFQDIAKAVGISQNTAASRYRYALIALRQALSANPSLKDFHV